MVLIEVWSKESDWSAAAFLWSNSLCTENRPCQTNELSYDNLLLDLYNYLSTKNAIPHDLCFLSKFGETFAEYRPWQHNVNNAA